MTFQQLGCKNGHAYNCTTDRQLQLITLRLSNITFTDIIMSYTGRIVATIVLDALLLSNPNFW